MDGFGSWQLSKLYSKILRDKQLTTTKPTLYILTTTLNLYSPINNNTQVKENVTTYIHKITFHTSSSMINTTRKNSIIILNKIFIPVFLSLILIILCTGLSYCIFIYLKHYFNMNSTITQDTSGLHRVSFASSRDSNDIQLYICTTENNVLPEEINKKNEERRSSTDSVKLFRY